jgi:hypothetical protein
LSGSEQREDLEGTLGFRQVVFKPTPRPPQHTIFAEYCSDIPHNKALFEIKNWQDQWSVENTGWLLFRQNRTPFRPALSPSLSSEQRAPGHCGRRAKQYDFILAGVPDLARPRPF